MPVFRYYIFTGLTCTLYILKMVCQVNHKDFKGLKDIQSWTKEGIATQISHKAYTVYIDKVHNLCHLLQSLQVWLKAVEPKYLMSCSPQFSQSSFAATDIAKHLEEGETDEDTQNREVKSWPLILSVKWYLPLWLKCIVLRLEVIYP